jgi:hypothetical protein
VRLFNGAGAIFFEAQHEAEFEATMEADRQLLEERRPPCEGHGEESGAHGAA